MRILSGFLPALLLIPGLACNSEGPREQPWVPLFNGTDLTGWTPKFSGYPAGENYKNTFTVRDSAISVNYAEYDSFRNEFGHLYSDKSYAFYRLRLDYRFVGDTTAGAQKWAHRNNGVMILCQSAESMGMDQNFPVSVEAQMLGGNGRDDRPTGNVCTPGTHIHLADTLTTTHCIGSSSPTYHGDQWVHMEIAVLPDGNIYHLIEGDTVMHYSNVVVGGDYLPEGYGILEGEELRHGHIALQAESHPTEFRNIYIQEIIATDDDILQ